MGGSCQNERKPEKRDKKTSFGELAFSLSTFLGVKREGPNTKTLSPAKFLSKGLLAPEGEVLPEASPLSGEKNEKG